jgi:hypothetical protein
MTTGKDGQILQFSKFPLLFHDGLYRIPDPNLVSIFGRTVRYDAPLKAATPAIETKFADYLGKLVTIRGSVDGWVDNGYSASVMTGITVFEIEEAEQ